MKVGRLALTNGCGTFLRRMWHGKRRTSLLYSFAPLRNLELLSRFPKPSKRGLQSMSVLDAASNTCRSRLVVQSINQHLILNSASLVSNSDLFAHASSAKDVISEDDALRGCLLHGECRALKGRTQKVATCKHGSRAAPGLLKGGRPTV